MKILILGGNGFIGFQVTRASVAAGHATVCLGRDIRAAKHRLPEAKWISKDLADLQSSTHWADILEDVDAVINCAGVLQDSFRDNIVAVQQKSLKALYSAAKNIHVVQISANIMSGTDAGKTDFLATKASADEALANSGLDYTILRPALVIGRNAYGGTTLLRAVASFPCFMPIPYGNNTCQTTDLEDLASIALRSASGEFGKKGDYSVAAAEKTTFGLMVTRLRAWLGLAPSKTVTVPQSAVNLLSLSADLVSWFGWRSPLRKTATTILKEGIVVDPQKPLIETRNLADTLSRHSAGTQDIWFGRLYLLKPVLVLALSTFWIVSGMVAIIQFDKAAEYLDHLEYSENTVGLIIVFTALVDCVLGITVLFRRYTRTAIWGMILVSCFYLASASIVAPNLWIDPIGPLVKVVPAILLAIATLAILEER